MTELSQIPLAQAMLQYHPSRILRWLKFRHKDSPGRYEFRWGSFDTTRFGLECELIQFSEDMDDGGLFPWCLSLLFGWGRIWIQLPIPGKGFAEDPMRLGQDSIRHWGLSWRWFDSSRCSEVVFEWKHKTIYCKLPWSLVHHQHRVLSKDGRWLATILGATESERSALEEQIAYELYPYRYLTDSGITQHVYAKISVHETERRRLGFKTWPRLAKIQRYIDVRFTSGIGERAILGTGTTLRIDETPREALKRMERTRRF